jgi:hypothetical protein
MIIFIIEIQNAFLSRIYKKKEKKSSHPKTTVSSIKEGMALFLVSMVCLRLLLSFLLKMTMTMQAREIVLLEESKMNDARTQHNSPLLLDRVHV